MEKSKRLGTLVAIFKTYFFSLCTRPFPACMRPDLPLATASTSRCDVDGVESRLLVAAHLRELSSQFMQFASSDSCCSFVSSFSSNIIRTMDPWTSREANNCNHLIQLKTSIHEPWTHQVGLLHHWIMKCISVRIYLKYIVQAHRFQT